MATKAELQEQLQQAKQDATDWEDAYNERKNDSMTLRAQKAELLAALETVRCWVCGEKVNRPNWAGCGSCNHLVAAIAKVKGE